MRSFFKFKPCNHHHHHPNQHHHSKRNDELKYEREMTQWRPFRYVGQLTSFAAFLLVCVATWSDNWMAGSEVKVGIWSTCYFNETETLFCEVKRPLWLSTIIVMMVATLIFATLANVLSFFGLCSSSLNKKLYYFNSAGEINLICGLVTLTVEVLYSVAMYVMYRLSPYYLSYAFGLSSFSSLLFFGAAVCMCIDEIVGSIRKLFGYDDDDDDDVRV